LNSCVNRPERDATNETSSTDSTYTKTGLIHLEKSGISLTEVQSMPFNEPELQLESPENADAARKDPHFIFSVDGDDYELGTQTDDKNAKMCSNSSKGQHIHFIVNNAGYSAYYEPEFDVDLQDSMDNVVLAFLSRSYHESIKSDRAFILKQFNFGDAPDVDLTQPMLFYSRPKGTYIGEFAGKVLLDFYLVNCHLSEDGFKVRATINGTSFLLTKWCPWFMEGLPMGENTVRIELVNADNEVVSSPFSDSGERVFNLEELAQGDQ
ncbi:MAG: hypothetical protein ACE5DN_07340, partial [Flavobacteriales bacterium]